MFKVPVKLTFLSIFEENVIHHKICDIICENENQLGGGGSVFIFIMEITAKTAITTHYYM